jgi:ABC-type polar amino acid transport system ATPase subunit
LIVQEFVEENLEKIINVRQEFRNGKIATTDIKKDLQNHLSKDRYLSILFVFQHLNLFKDMINNR